MAKKENGRNVRNQDGSEVCYGKSFLTAGNARNGDLDSSKQRLMSTVNMNKDEKGLTVRNEACFQNPLLSVNYPTRPTADPRIASVNSDTAPHVAARSRCLPATVSSSMEHHDIKAEDNSSLARPTDVCLRSTDGRSHTSPSSHSNIGSKVSGSSGNLALMPACQPTRNSSLAMNSRNINVDNNNNVKVKVKPHVSINSVIDVNNKGDGNESGITASSAVCSVAVTNVASSSTLDQDEIGCLSVENVGVGGNSVIHSDGTTERANNIQFPRCNEESSSFHGHAVVLNMQHEESSMELSTCRTPPSLTRTTSIGMSTTNSDKTEEVKCIPSKVSNVDWVELDTVHESNGCHGKMTATCTAAATNDNSIDNTPADNSDRRTSKNTYRHRNDRTLHSHTATQGEKHKKRHDATITKERKLRSLSDAVTSNGDSSHQNRSSGSNIEETESVSSPPIVTSRSTSSNEPSSVLLSSNPAANVRLVEDAQGCATVTVPTPVDCQSSDDEKEVSDGNSQSTVLYDNDAIDMHMSCVSETEHEEQQVSSSVSNCDTNAVLSCCEMSYTTK
ncbi:unnamed protein product [Schistosoma turkestanicum]|nr:unnamed protein product [Schistosoma turkestanicum]